MHNDFLYSGSGKNCMTCMTSEVIIKYSNSSVIFETVLSLTYEHLK
jgi:hypothetical protein